MCNNCETNVKLSTGESALLLTGIRYLRIYKLAQPEVLDKIVNKLTGIPEDISFEGVF